MALNNTRSNVPHTYITSIRDSQISLSFALRWVFFDVQDILRQVHWMALNNLDLDKVKCSKLYY